METQPQPKQPPRTPAFRWRVALALISAGVWALWFVLVNRGKPFQVLPSDADLRQMHDWFKWWWILWLKIIPVVGDLLIGIIVGAVVLPWGLSLTLSALVLPVLSLLRPHRNLELSIRVSLFDF